MARRTKEEAQQTRCHIMSTALDLFCQQGLARTSLTDIAKAADLTRGAIYWHFKNKEELFVTLWEELCAPLSHQLDACVDEAERTSAARRAIMVLFYSCSPRRETVGRLSAPVSSETRDPRLRPSPAD